MALQTSNLKIIVIGNGVAGNNAALAARANDKNAEITIISGEPHTEYSACALPDYLAGSIGRENVFIKNHCHYAAHNIKTLFGCRVKEIDSLNKRVSLGNKHFGYDKLIIATGSSPFLPPVKGIELAGNFVVKTLDHVEKIRAYPADSAVVVGSGAIGIEAAIALKERGYNEVTIVEMMERILPKSFSEKPAQRLEAILHKNSINVLTSTKIEEVYGKQKVTGVKTDSRDIHCNLIIWAVGVKPKVELARTMGVELGETGGIKVDEYLQTSVPDIYACGDCIESLDLCSGQPALNLLWQSACEQGKTAGSNCVKGRRKYEGARGVLLVDFCGVKALSCGLVPGKNNSAEYHVLEKTSENSYKCLVSQNGKIVGVQLVGTLAGAGPLLSLMKKGTPISELNKTLENPSLAPVIMNSVLFTSYL